jgi:hypothetical protein
MKKLKRFTCLLLIIFIINACSKGCPDGAPTEKNVDKTYLPYIIPYSDTSTRLFLKNGKDTLLFKSQGLKETTEIQGVAEVCDKYKLQKYSLKMAASDTDYFEVNYYAGVNWGPSVNYYFNVGNFRNKTNEYSESGFKFYTNFPPIIKRTILNTIYDSINSLPDQNFEEIFVKPNLGLIKVKTSKYTLELIK